MTIIKNVYKWLVAVVQLIFYVVFGAICVLTPLLLIIGAFIIAALYLDSNIRNIASCYHFSKGGIELSLPITFLEGSL